MTETVELELDWDSVGVYPRTEMVTGKCTRESVLRAEAELLYDEWVCDRRYQPLDVAKMILLWSKERNGSVKI